MSHALIFEDKVIVHNLVYLRKVLLAGISYVFLFKNVKFQCYVSIVYSNN